ncbi:membrane protein insertion efficiency factor YidD [Streptomyces sp. NPDC001889]
MVPRGRRDRKKNADGEEEEGCCATTLDTLSHPCCCGGGISGQIHALFALLGHLALTSGHGTDPAAPPPGGRIAAAMYRSVRHYRVTISPNRPPCCPYTPSCSTYAVKALHRHGALRGGRLILTRLLRCRPAAVRRHGRHDPVPPLRR